MSALSAELGPPRFDVLADLGTGFGMLAVALDAPFRERRSSSHDAHVAVAASRGGVQLAVSQHPPVVRALNAPRWWVVRLQPASRLDHAAFRNATPRDVNVMKHARQAALSAGMVLAFERGDLALLHEAGGEAIIEPAVGPMVPGFFPARAAALEAGAAICSLCDRDGTIGAICGDEATAHRVAAAATQALDAHRLASDVLVAAIAPEVP